jgi:hypothetical protein
MMTEPSGDPEAMSCGSCGGNGGPIGEFGNGIRAWNGYSLDRVGILRVVEELDVPECGERIYREFRIAKRQVAKTNVLQPFPRSVEMQQ